MPVRFTSAGVNRPPPKIRPTIGLRKRDHERRREKAESDDAGNRVGHASGELKALFLGPKLREEGHRGDSGGLRQHRHRRREELLGVGQPRNISGAVRRIEAGKVLVEERQGEAEHERQRHEEPHAQPGMMKIDFPAKANARTGHAPGIDGERTDEESERWRRRPARRCRAVRCSSTPQAMIDRL